MAEDPHAAELRRRAVALRRMAGRLDDTPLLALHRWAGDDTWGSPHVEACRERLARDQARLCVAADELRFQAWRLDRQAEMLESVAALAAALP